MKKNIILRILLLPFAWILWTIIYSKKWILEGGELAIGINKDSINPRELLLEIKTLNGKIEILNESIKTKEYEIENK